MMNQLQADLLPQFLNSLVEPFESAACVTGEGEILHLKYETVADIGTLGLAASTVTKYFPLQLGDVVLLNDPYSGGTTLSMMTLVTPLIVGHSQIPNLMLAVRFGFRAQLTLSKTLEEEGLRIPPTPLAQGRKLNTLVLDAITAHPHCPQNLVTRIEANLQLMWNRVDSMQMLAKKDPMFCSRSMVKNYLQQSRASMLNFLSEFPTGETKVESPIDSGEAIRLRFEIQNEAVLFDFAGTSASSRLCLTDAATFGACFGALASFFSRPLPMNSGTFSLLQVMSPVGCLLNAKYPSPTFRGMTEGTAEVAGTVLKALAEIVPQRRVANSAQSPAQICLEFSPQLKFFDALAGGSSATAQKAGEDAVPLWTRNHLKNSVQEIETRFPLRIEHIRVRSASGGAGEYRGGDGVVKEFLLLAPAELRWLLPGRKNTKKTKASSQGLAAEIQVLTVGAAEPQIVQLEEGKLSLKAGDRVRVLSAGGGGFL